MKHPPDKEKAPSLMKPASNNPNKRLNNDNNIIPDIIDFNHIPSFSNMDFRDPIVLLNFLLAVTGATHDSYVGIARKINGRFIRSNHSPTEFLQLLQGTPGLMDDNFWFCCSALNSKQGQKASECVCTQSVIVDLDYGVAGHKKQSFFSNEEQALDCLRLLPVRPSLAWNTGHGLQAAFMLDQPVYYDDPAQIDKLEEFKRYFYKVTHSDCTQSIEHLFRFPCSMNCKPGCEPVCGRVIEL